MPALSVILVNWNGERHLRRCLDALAAQTFKDFELIVIDNASQDDSVAEIEAHPLHLKLFRLEKNSGFAAANNLGAGQAEGRWIVTLNNDAFPKPEWLARLVEAASSHPDYAFFASHLVQATQEQRIDGTGDVYHASGLAWHRDHNRTAAEVDREAGEVFSPCAAAAMYEKAAFQQVGGFDERYWSHHEDVDLGFRLRLSGYRCLYVPGAVVEHIGSASFGKESDRTVYQVHRNLVWCYVSNMPGALLWKNLPAHLLANLIFLVFYSSRGQGKAIWRAKWDALCGLPAALRKRRAMQQARKVNSQELDRLMDHNLLSPYTLGRHSEKIQRLAGSVGLKRE